MSVLAFYRYRHLWAHGNSGWEYKIYGIVNDVSEVTRDDLDEMARMLSATYELSDLFRGTEVEIEHHPPIEWLMETLSRSRRQALYYARQEELLRAVISTEESRG